MRIAVEAIALSKNNLTGIGNVVLNYLNELQKIDKDNEYIIYSIQELQHLSIENPKWKVIEIGSSSSKSSLNKIKRIIGFLFSLISIPFSLRKNKIDIYLGTSDFYYPLFFLAKVKKMVIVYDLVWKLFPETVLFYKRIIFNLISKWNFKRMDRLISISESTKKDIDTLLDDGNKNIVIPIAADNNLFYKANLSSIKSIKIKYNIQRDYILTVSTLEPRKNLIALLKSFSRIKNMKDYSLIIVGAKGWIDDSFFNLIEELGIRNNVTVTGYVDNEDLAPLYSGASVFVFPSIYEGFGLPVLEAMQCGCPVITSNSSSLPEVIGKAGFTVEPKEIDKLASTIDKVLKNKDLRKTMKEKGLKRSKQFSWPESTEKLLKEIKIINNS